MYRTKTKAVHRVAVATTLSVGLAAGVAGIAAADGNSPTSHDNTSSTLSMTTRVGGTVLSYVAGTSISVLTKGATTPTLYALDATTTISGLAAGATAPVVGDNVDLVLSTTTPITVTSITLDAPRDVRSPMKVEGTVLAYVAGTSISVTTTDSSTPTLYALDGATTFTGLAGGVTAPAVGDSVELVLSSTTPAVVVSINDESGQDDDATEQATQEGVTDATAQATQEGVTDATEQATQEGVTDAQNTDDAQDNQGGQGSQDSQGDQGGQGSQGGQDNQGGQGSHDGQGDQGGQGNEGSGGDNGGDGGLNGGVNVSVGTFSDGSFSGSSDNGGSGN